MITIGAKLTPAQQAKWKELGGAQWLREQLCKQIELDRTGEMARVFKVKTEKRSNKELIASLEKILDEAKSQIKKVVV